MRFEFASAGRIVFGPGTIAELPGLAAAFGKRAFIVTGGDKIRHAGVVAGLEGAGFHCCLFGVGAEPSVQLVRDGAAALRAHQSDVAIAIGGGSAIDAGKAIAALASNPGDVLDYLEVIGQGRPMLNASLPFVAVPTTAGTGSEVTRNAVLQSPEHRVKASLRAASMLPRIALVDPELTYGLSKQITASTGLDAITQLIEPYVSIRSNPFTDSICLDGLNMAGPAIARAYENGRDAEARARMAYASLLGGLALANAGLGVVHGFAAPVGGMFDAPHGAVCAVILPQAMRVNIAALRAREPESPALTRYDEVARLLTGNPAAKPEDGADWVESLVRRFEMPGLSAYGLTGAHIPELVSKAATAGSMKSNPIVLNEAELMEVLRRSI